MRRPGSSPSRFPRLLVGLVLLGTGLAFFFGRFTAADFFALLRFWPLLLVAHGALQLPRRRPGAESSTGDGATRRQRLRASLWIAAGLLLLADNLSLLPFELSDLAPLVPAALGLHLVRRGWRGPAAEEGVPSPYTDALVIAGGLSRGHRSPAFRGGSLTAIMGGCEVDLTACRLDGEEAVLDVFALWGGLDVRVPPGWEVVSEVLPLLGGFDDKTAAAEHPLGRLRVRGMAVMGGVEIRG